jgi:hypothetical protein
MVNYRGISHLEEWDNMSEHDRKCNYNILKNSSIYIQYISLLKQLKFNTINKQLFKDKNVYWIVLCDMSLISHRLVTLFSLDVTERIYIWKFGQLNDITISTEAYCRLVN